MSEIRVTSVVGENGGDRVGLTTGLTVGPLTGTTGIGATISHQGHAQFAGVCTATSFSGSGAGLTNISAGKVLQVQSTLKTDTSTYTLSGGALSAIIFSVNITPASASNKIIIHAHLSVGLDSNGEEDFAMCLTKGGSNYNTLSGDANSGSSRVFAVGSTHAHTYHQQTVSATAVDTAGGTSAITYGIALRLRDNGSCTGYVNRHQANDVNAWDFMPTSGITVMEVEA